MRFLGVASCFSCLEIRSDKMVGESFVCILKRRNARNTHDMGWAWALLFFLLFLFFFFFFLFFSLR